ncbi:MAG: hypothetical protein KF774_05820 [Planctomyces sp.]|nr:hypothetical protein [Planctomyces sp.]
MSPLTLRLFALFVGAVVFGSPVHVFAEPRLAAPIEDVAKQLLDDERPGPERETLIQAHGGAAPELIAAMSRGLGDDLQEEYRRIPWIWRVAVAAGRRNDTAELRRMLDVSLPREGEQLTDWQAVVVGGGAVMGVSDAGAWPAERIPELLGDSADLKARWGAVVDLASAMADHEPTNTGTRYDALRLIAVDGWTRRGEQLTRYLRKGTHAELQMGAVSATADVRDPAATQALLNALPGLEEENRKLALRGLMRTEDRQLALLEAVRTGAFTADLLDAPTREALRESRSPEIRELAAQILAVE